jgi:hypothetical protein
MDFPVKEKEIRQYFSQIFNTLNRGIEFTKNINCRILKGKVAHNTPTTFKHNLGREVTGAILLSGRACGHLTVSKDTRNITISCNLVSSNVIVRSPLAQDDRITVSDSSKFKIDDIIKVDGKFATVLSSMDGSLKLSRKVNTPYGSEAILDSEDVIFLVI